MKKSQRNALQALMRYASANASYWTGLTRLK
ncbi:hypothetical protein NIES2107_25080 [Nostoc carneum NIES-2107]|nr:hypothetical protein NIES2107_25080 [Nostoc carneum NIES-2107]